MAIGYESPNRDPRNQPVEVRELTEQEATLQDDMAKLRYAILAGERAKITAQQLAQQCSHRVFNDLPGDPYSTRQCAICKMTLGFI